MTSEVLQKDVHHQSVGAAFQISERQIHKQHGTLFIRLLTGHQSVAGAKQNFTSIFAGSHETGILEIAVFVPSELDLEVVCSSRWAILMTRVIGFRMERIVLTGRYLQLTDDYLVAGDLAPLNRLIFKLVVECVVHTR